jgi:hypothetical protein|tara:strand:+ start:846 stop:1058 length:213 start_codon:yes stop_codon:yes gene_type:complete
MGRTLFDQYASGCAVREPVRALDGVLDGSSPEEAEFYRYLLTQERGRLEQEFVHAEQVSRTIRTWLAADG